MIAQITKSETGCASAHERHSAKWENKFALNIAEHQTCKICSHTLSFESKGP